MRGLLSIILLLVTTHVVAQSQETLARYLQGSAATTSNATTFISGETLDLYPFKLSALTNSSHSLISLNLSKAVHDVGWVAVGFGSSMQDSAMVMLWPSGSGSNWTISHRSAGGHSAPTVSMSIGSTPPFVVIPELSILTSTSTSVSFLRPLSLPSDQKLFSSSKYLNISRTERSQRLIYAFSKDRPATMSTDSGISQHDSGSFGSTAVDLTKAFVGSEVGSWTRYDTVVMIHGTASHPQGP